MLTNVFSLPDDRAAALGRVLLLAIVVSLLVSTSLAVGFEIVAYLTFLTQPTLRRRVRAVTRHPLAIGLLVFMVPIVLAAFYGPASGRESAMALFAWRRVLILPLALAVFDDDGAKILAAKSVLVVGLLGAAASFLTAAFDLTVSAKIGSGIVYKNYVTQGMFLSIGVAVALTALLRPRAVENDPLLGSRIAMIGAVLLLVADIVYVLPGRSGYLSVLVISVGCVVLLFPGAWKLKLGTGAIVAMILTSLLVSSTVTRERISQAVAEITDVDQAKGPTSVGQRMVFLRNTVRMVAEHPVFGVGTGGFMDAYRRHVPDLPGWQGQDTGDPHNQYAKILAEQGSIGLVAMFFFLYRGFVCPGTAPFRQLAVAVLLGWCFTSLASSHFSTFSEGRMIYFWLGAMLAGAPRSKVAVDPPTWTRTVAARF